PGVPQGSRGTDREVTLAAAGALEPSAAAPPPLPPEGRDLLAGAVRPARAAPPPERRLPGSDSSARYRGDGPHGPGNAPAGTAERTADGLTRGHGHGAYERWIRRVQMLLLREVADAGRAADLRSRGVHLRRVHRAVQRDHRRGDPGRPARLAGAGAVARPAGDLRLPRAVRRRPGARQARTVGRGLQPL